MKTDLQSLIKIIIITSNYEICSVFLAHEQIEVIAQFESLRLASMSSLITKADYVLIDSTAMAQLDDNYHLKLIQKTGFEKIVILSNGDLEGITVSSSLSNCNSDNNELKIFNKPWDYVEIFEYLHCGDYQKERTDLLKKGVSHQLDDLESFREYAKVYQISPKDLEHHSIVPSRKTIAVINSKGGVGKTFLSVNMACYYSKMKDHKTVLFDANLGSGDIALHLNMINAKTVTDLIPDIELITKENIEQHIPCHPKLPLKVILGPDSPELCEFVTNEHIKHLLATVIDKFDTIVIDTPSNSFNSITYDILDIADVVVLVTTCELTSLQQARMSLYLMKRLGIDIDSNVKVILNKVASDSVLMPDKIEEFLGKKISGVIPTDPSVVDQSILKGKPIMADLRALPIKKDLENVFESLYQTDNPNMATLRKSKEKSMLASIKNFLFERKDLYVR